MSLYKTLLSQTTNHDYTSLNRLYEIGKNYKQSTVERAMRDVARDTGLTPYDYLDGLDGKELKLSKSFKELKSEK